MTGKEIATAFGLAMTSIEHPASLRHFDIAPRFAKVFAGQAVPSVAKSLFINELKVSACP